MKSQSFSVTPQNSCGFKKYPGRYADTAGNLGAAVRVGGRVAAGHSRQSGDIRQYQPPRCRRTSQAESWRKQAVCLISCWPIPSRRPPMRAVSQSSIVAAEAAGTGKKEAKNALLN